MVETKKAGAMLPKPMEDIAVLDMTTALAGPFATFLLAGLGARVIKMENPASGDACRENPPYLGAGGASLVRQSTDDISVSAINRLRNWVNTMILFIAKSWVIHQKKFRN
jgi:CoA:oxalate CoA-transferase